jgi:hypothetical protein
MFLVIRNLHSAITPRTVTPVPGLSLLREYRHRLTVLGDEVVDRAERLVDAGEAQVRDLFERFQGLGPTEPDFSLYGRSMSAWMSRFLAAASENRSGVVRRAISEVENYETRTTFIEECRRSGYHVIEFGDQLVIFCYDLPLIVHC